MALVCAAFVPSSLLIPYKTKAERKVVLGFNIDLDIWHLNRVL